MPRKCSVANCKTNYATNSEQCVHVYQFPSDEVLRQSWISALPNGLKKVTKFMGVCRLHWPENAEMKLRFGHLIPAHPPSVFLNCPPSHVRQTVSTRSRDVEKRSISISQTLNRTKCMSFRYVTLSRMILKLFVWNFRRSTKTQRFMLFFLIMLSDYFILMRILCIILSPSHPHFQFLGKNEILSSMEMI